MFLTLNVAPPAGGTGTVTANIARRSNLQVAPESVFFDVTIGAGFSTSGANSTGYNAQHHDLYYFWDYGALDEYSFTAPLTLWTGSDKHTDGHKNARYGYGPLGAHVFRTVGTHTVTVTVYEPATGVWGSDTISVTVGNPDTAFPTTRTVYADPSGTYANAPTGCVQTTEANIGTLVSTYALGNDTTSTRFLLAGGQTFNTASGITLGAISSGNGSIHFIGYGASKATVTCNGGGWNWHDLASAAGHLTKDLVFDNLDLTSTAYDETTTNTRDDYDSMMVFREGPPGMTVIDRCDLDGLPAIWVGFDLPGVGQHALHINDTVQLNSAYGGLDSNIEYFASTGVRRTPGVNCLVDSTPGVNQPGWYVRIQNDGNEGVTCKGVFSQNDLLAMQGWSAAGGTDINIAVQSPIRWIPNTKESLCCIWGNTVEGGYDSLSIGWSGSGAETPNLIIEKNYFMGNFQADRIMGLAFSGTTVRNNILNNPTVTGTEDEQQLFQYILLSPSGTITQPLRIYNNTFVNNSTHDGTPLLVDVNSGVIGDWAGYEFANNIEHQPGPSGTTADAPLGDDTNLFTPGYPGYNKSGGDFRSTTATSPTAGNTDLYDPETGSAAIGDATTGTVAYDDFRGIIRDNVLGGLTRSTESRGAFEPSIES